MKTFLATVLAAAFAIYPLTILIVSASPALAVTCSVTQSTPQFIEMNRGGTVFRVNQSDLRTGSDALRSADLQDRLTAIIEFRQTRADLPIDDPDRFIDPGGPLAGTGTDGLGLGERLYWCDVDGNPTPGDTVLGTHMCAPGDCVIDSVTLDEFGAFILGLRRSRDCAADPTFPSCL